MADAKVLHPIPSSFVAVTSGYKEGPPLRVRSEPSSPGARPDTLVLQVQDLEKLAGRDFGIENPDVIAYAFHPGDCRRLVVRLLECLSECGDHEATQILHELEVLVDRLRTERYLGLDDSFQDT